MQNKNSIFVLTLTLAVAACNGPAAVTDVPTTGDTFVATDAPTNDVVAADMPNATDVPSATDVPAATDVPSPTDVPSAPADVPTANDVPTPNDTPNPVDVPMMMMPRATVVACAGLVPSATVTAPGFAFTPMMTSIAVGQVVRFDMPAFHDAVSNDMLFDADFNMQTCVRFNTAGTFNFFCRPHGFTGSIVVR